MLDALTANDYDADGFRVCSVTGLDIHESAENMVKLFGLTAVVALVVGGLFAIPVALTRWELVGMLSPADFYTFLSVHAWYLLIFWMVFLEIAILYVGGPFVLGRPLPLKRLAQTAYLVMVGGMLLITYAILTTSAPNQAPLLTAYVPLPSEPNFYLGASIFLFGALLAAVPFLASIYLHRKENPGSSLPLVAFGAFITAIVAAEAILGGLATFVPTYLWRIGVLSAETSFVGAAWYRQFFWTIGHGSQQINLLAMITVWYFLTHVVGGATVASQKVSRFAFVLYLFFINMGAAHHLVSDPVVSTGWRLWNTSYAAYGAVIASMIHAFAIPAGLEIGRRARGEGGGLFGWLWSAPWRDPGFSATILSIVMFGFLGGITGVMMGQLQLNMTWHNTLAVPGHFHATVAVGTTLAFMGLVYYVLKLVFRREWVLEPLAAVQPYFYAGTMGVVVIMMMYLGVLYGVPRRHPSVMNIPGTDFSFAAASPLFAIFGIAAILAILGGALFAVVAVATLLFGEETEPRSPVQPAAVADGGQPDAGVGAGETDDEGVVDGEDDGALGHAYSMRGTFVLVMVFLLTFAVMMALNWYLLANLWKIGP